MTKHAEILKQLEIRQAQSLKLARDCQNILSTAAKTGYQNGDSAFDLLKQATARFLSDANATHSTATGH